MVVSGKDKRSIRMKKLVVVAMAAAALAAAAMPTEEEFAKASKDVQAALNTQIASWQRGEIADGDLAALMLMNADKFKDEARHYACLQAAFAAAVRAGDAVLAAKAYERICAETDGFTPKLGEAMIGKTLAKVDAKKAKHFRRRLDEERANVKSCASAADKLGRIMIPTVSIKPQSKLDEVVGLMRKLSMDNDTEQTGKGVNFLLKQDGIAYPAVPKIACNDIKLRDLLRLVVDSVGYDYKVEGEVVMIFKKDSDASIRAKLDTIMIPAASIKPQSKLDEVVGMLRRYSVENDRVQGGRGVNFVLAQGDGAFPAVPKIVANNLKLRDLLRLVVDSVGYDYKIAGGVVEIFRKK